MAKRRRSSALARVRTVKPIVIRTTKIVKSKKKHHRGGGGMGLGLGGFLSANRTQMGIAGAVLGFLDKQEFVQNLPKLPFLGEHGTIAIGAYFLSQGGKNKIADNICTLAIALAGYELAKEGHIEGPDAFGF